MRTAKPSIYHRLSLGLVFGVGSLLLLAGFTADRLIEQYLANEYDRSLQAKGNTLITLVEQNLQGVEFDFADEIMPEFSQQQDREYFQFWLADGTVFERSRSLKTSDLPRRTLGLNTSRFADLTLPDGRAGRCIQIDFFAHIDDDVPLTQLTALQAQALTLVLARERETLDHFLTTVRLIVLTVGLIVIALLILLVRTTLWLGLRPLTDIRNQLARFDTKSLDMRLQLSMQPIELEGMVTQFNQLLDRVQQAFERERCFSADVAHELRTPLAELHNLAEVGGKWPQDAQMAQDYFSEILAATQQLERIVTNLLALARCESALDIVVPTQVDLAALIDTAWQHVAKEAGEKHIVLQRELRTSAILQTGHDQLELILNNLLSNAVCYSPLEASILCTVYRDQKGLTISIANPTEQLDPGDLVHIFDRLWRKDPARTGGYHAGLGLSLVRAYAQQLECSVSAVLEPGPVFRIALVFPAL